MSSARPYRLVGEKTLGAARGTLQLLLVEWMASWFPEPPEGDFQIAGLTEERPEHAGGSWHVLGGDSGDVWIAWSFDESRWLEFGRLLFGPGLAVSRAPSDLVKAMLDACLADLGCRILKAAGMDLPRDSAKESSLAGFRTGRGSAAISGLLAGRLPPVQYVLGGAVTTSLAGGGTATNPGARKRLTNREESVKDLPTRVSVSLGEAHLSVGELANISVGDVICLDIPYHAPASVLGIGGTPLFQCHLGSVGGHKAIQIIERKNG